jgi:hypothetical protein
MPGQHELHGWSRVRERLRTDRPAVRGVRDEYGLWSRRNLRHRDLLLFVKGPVAGRGYPANVRVSLATAAGNPRTR